MDRLCECGGVLVKARIADLFEFPERYEPVNPIARAKLARSLELTHVQSSVTAADPPR